MNVNMRKRHPGGHGSGGHHSGGMGQNNNRRMHQKYPKQNGYGQQKPRKNYSALREKYLNQAKEALSGGDRVLAEYYLQHADHYYRMMMEMQENRARWQEQNQANQQENAAEAESEGEEMEGDDEPEVDIPNNSNVLPAFLTRKVEAPKQQDQDNAAPMQEWEEDQR